MNRSAYEAAVQAAAWRPLSHFGRFVVSGRDAATLLHHLSTNDIKALRPNSGCEAALISAKARLLDWLSIYRAAEGFTVISSPNRRDIFAPHARRFVLYRQQVEIEDVTEQSAMWGLIGPEASEVLYRLIGEPVVLENNRWLETAIDGVSFRVARTPRLPDQGLWLWSSDIAGMQRIVTQSALPIVNDETYNVLRVEAGVPAAGLELTEEINPWEARLDASISLSKGCYNGQEVVARLNTYQKISKRLCGLSLSAPIPMGTRAELKSEAKEGARTAGWITSSVTSPRYGPIALGVVRGEWQAEGTELQVLYPASSVDGIEQDASQIKATVRALPFRELTDALIEEKR